ncbi:MarR family winged helix-turn-helix transcriptional regulator [Labrys portucalensis]|uniref:MarR family winged helix-turn-helix transcriptional regulator n=1 Tax=Labrys neptuniae TaxID=376174 RepID=A0ABV6Z790_9HYPH
MSAKDALMTPPDRSPDRASAAWRLMFDYLMRSSPQRLESLQSRGLTPNDSRVLFTLDREEARPIGTLARQWGADPSTATWLVDRLERAGLAERSPAPGDRRVKLVRLTEKGEATRKELMEEYYRTPREVAALAPVDLAELVRIFSKLNQGVE